MLLGFEEGRTSNQAKEELMMKRHKGLSCFCSEV